VYFWNLNHPPAKIALIQAETDRICTYGQLQTIVNKIAAEIHHNRKTLGFIFCKNNLASISCYLAALQQKQSVYLLDANLEHSFVSNLIEAYRPDWLWLPEEHEKYQDFEVTFSTDGYALQIKTILQNEPAIYSELALLLTTSGSTGSPKLVRLSYGNLQANADSIAEYLMLTSEERPITTLPMHYSYGLSVINSHLNTGATLLLTDDSLMTETFWSFFQRHGATSMAGVPYTYQMLFRLQFSNMKLPSLKTMTQAGGRLDINLQKFFANQAGKQNIRFFVMYGQTEATARMSYVPQDKLLDNLGSIGVAIPKGTFEIDETNSELIYYGPNVMLGYAESREDLALGDILQGKLATGDIARMDAATGLFYITARKKRFLKLVGQRVNLDEIEQTLENLCQTNCYCIGSDDHLIVILSNADLLSNVKLALSQHLKIHSTLFTIKVETDIPHLPTGKTDYQELQKRFLE